jgi:hypothetical protein
MDNARLLSVVQEQGAGEVEWAAEGLQKRFPKTLTACVMNSKA